MSGADMLQLAVTCSLQAVYMAAHMTVNSTASGSPVLSRSPIVSY